MKCFMGLKPVSQIKKIPSTPTHTTYFPSKLWFVPRRQGRRAALKIRFFFLSFCLSPFASGAPLTSEESEHREMPGLGLTESRE